MLNLDFDRICRLCLTEGEEMIPIFNEPEKGENGRNVSHQIESCTCIKLDKCDGLPGALCTACLSKLDNIKEFQDQCQRSDRVLRESLQIKEKEKHGKAKGQKLQGKREGTANKGGERSKGKRKKTDREKPDSLHQETVENLDTGSDWNDYEPSAISTDSLPDGVKLADTINCKDTETQSAQPQLGPSLSHETKTLSDEFVDNGKGDICSNDKNENGLDSDDNDFSWPGRLSDEDFDPTSEGLNKSHKGNRAITASKSRKKAGKKYECEYCGRTFPRSNHLAQHELTHTKEKPFQCSYCQKGFWYKNSLIGHIKQTHTGDVNFTCDECGRGFFQKSEFMRHKPIHSNETPFKCDECDMSFKLMKNLKRHQKVHTATRTHTCQYCGKSFRMLQTLRVHLILHSGEKPYKCSFCGRGFSQSAPLKAHVRMHTGERPYICNLCGESFPTGSSLKSHVFKHTGIHPYSCKDCSLVLKRKRDLIDHRNKVHGGAETALMQVPPLLPPIVEQTYTQESTSHLNDHQPLHFHSHPSSHLSSPQIHQSLPPIEDVTNETLDALSEDSLSGDLVSHHQILQNQVSQVLAMSSPSHLMSPSLVKSDSDELVTSDLHFV